MDELKTLWWSRVQGFWGEAGKYLKIIITGYAYLPMIFLLVLGSLYKFLLQWLPADFPVTWVLAFILAILISRSSVRTFIKKADLVFLLPLESKLPRYFLRSYLYSFLIQSLGLTVLVFLLAPIYTVRISHQRSDIYLVIIAVIILKAWNLFAAWQGQKETDDWQRKIFGLLCFLQNLSWCSVLFGAPGVNPWLAVGLTIVSTWFIAKNLQQSYEWFRLLDLEERQKSTFYSFAQWFLEIPELSRKVGNRPFLVKMINWLPHKPQWAYVYKFLRTFIRYNDLFYGYLRLVLISCFLLAYIRHFYLSAFLLLLFLLLNMLHLANGWTRVKQHFWHDIYPLPQLYLRYGCTWAVGVLLVLHLIIMVCALLYPYSVARVTVFFVVGIGMVAVGTGLLLPKLIKES
jgi:ABC-2 type transport system permease protein